MFTLLQLNLDFYFLPNFNKLKFQFEKKNSLHSGSGGLETSRWQFRKKKNAFFKDGLTYDSVAVIACTNRYVHGE